MHLAIIMMEVKGIYSVLVVKFLEVNILTKKDRENINYLIDEAYLDRRIKRKENVVKLKRILAVLIYLSRKCADENGELQWMKKLNNVPNEITDITLERLTGVSHKFMDSAIALFESLGIVDSVIFRGGTKFKVLFQCNEGDTWFETDDYNKAGTMIRDYFRINKEKNGVFVEIQQRNMDKNNKKLA